MDPSLKSAVAAAATASTVTAGAGLLAAAEVYAGPVLFGAGGAVCALAFVRMDPPRSAVEKVTHIVGSAFLSAAATHSVIGIFGIASVPNVQSLVSLILGIGAPVIVRTVWDAVGGWLLRFVEKRGR